MDTQEVLVVQPSSPQELPSVEAPPQEESQENRDCDLKQEHLICAKDKNGKLLLEAHQCSSEAVMGEPTCHDTHMQEVPKEHSCLAKITEEADCQDASIRNDSVFDKAADSQCASFDPISHTEEFLCTANDCNNHVIAPTCASLRAQMDHIGSDRASGVISTHSQEDLKTPMISYLRVNEGHDTALLVHGIQQSSALISSPSLAADRWLRHVEFTSPQKVVEEGIADGGNHTHEESFLRVSNQDESGVLVKDVLLPTFTSSYQQSSEPENNILTKVQDSTCKDDTESSKSSTQEPFSFQISQVVEFKEKTVHDSKTSVNVLSLRDVLSDSMTGMLMDDAMVAQCGHSFGISSLQRVIEMNRCMSCGASVPPGSLIPNYVLRAAVQAYKRDEDSRANVLTKGPKRRKDSIEHLYMDGKKVASFSSSTQSRSKGVQFPFIVNDRVVIKGNKRTPERFVGREAVVASQCLNGWYLVRTLDTGESVRLQYRSLQGLGAQQSSSLIQCGVTWL